MSNRLLLAAARSERLRRRVESARLTRSAAGRFFAGATADDAATAVEAGKQRGLSATVDLLGENTTTAAQAAAIVDGYSQVLRVLKARGLADAAEASVKLTALGLDVSDVLAFENLLQLCATAEDAGTTLTVDMETSDHVDMTLKLVARARIRFPRLGVVVQAYLRRTRDDCRVLAVGRCRVRLCKGAYSAPREVAYRGRNEIRESFEECLGILMRGDGLPMVATHDPQLIAAARSMAPATGRGPSDYELQMLYGVRTDEQARLAAEGCRVRIYIPFGDNWYGYFVRRVAERPANLRFALRAVLSRG